MTTSEEIGKKNAERFLENLDRSFDELRKMSNVDLKATFRELFIRQGKTPEQAEHMATLAVSRDTKDGTGGLEGSFRLFYIGEGKTPEVAERMARIAAQGR